MTFSQFRPIDCDVHPVLPGIHALMPYLSDHWRESAEQRGLHEFDLIAYPDNSPLTSRRDWRSSDARAGTDLDLMRKQALEPFATRLAICNCLYGIQLLFSEYMAAGFASALNDWIAKEWLDKEPRLRASIIVPSQNPEMAVDEINRCAADRRFVQVMMLVNNDMPLGKRFTGPSTRRRSVMAFQ